MEKEFQETRFSAKILDLYLQSNRCDVKHKQRRRHSYQASALSKIIQVFSQEYLGTASYTESESNRR